MATVQGNGNLLIGKAYTAQLGLQPGDPFQIQLGRRQIRGITPGRAIIATGRITCNDTNPTIFNPRYELHEAQHS